MHVIICFFTIHSWGRSWVEVISRCDRNWGITNNSRNLARGFKMWQNIEKYKVNSERIWGVQLTHDQMKRCWAITMKINKKSRNLSFRCVHCWCYFTLLPSALGGRENFWSSGGAEWLICRCPQGATNRSVPCLRLLWPAAVVPCSASHAAIARNEKS